MKYNIPHNFCTWDENSACHNCSRHGKLACKWDKKIQKGFQLCLQLILGYRFEFFNNRLFVESAYAIKYGHVNTNFPKSFADIERGAPNYKFEPSLNFGFRF